MRRAIIVSISLFFIVILMGTNELLKEKEEGEIEFREVVSDYIYKSNIENNCLKFINTSMVSDEGAIYTNYLPANEVTEMASGHQVLSESMGLMMLYYSRGNNRDSFDKHYRFLKDNMIVGDKFIKWRHVGEGDDTVITSTVDDLRIIRALLFAYTRWNDKEYLSFAEKLSNALINDVRTKNVLVDFYDTRREDGATLVSMPYLDIYTMELLVNIDSRWQLILDSSKNIIDNAYIGDEFPFYRASFDLSTGKYDESNRLNMTESLVTALHLAEAGILKEETIGWLKDILMKERDIYSYYDSKGNPLTDQQSTAIYALVCRIGKQTRDGELYELAFKRLDDYYVGDKESKIYGAFGDYNTLEVYSFDNLQGLLAF